MMHSAAFLSLPGGPPPRLFAGLPPHRSLARRNRVRAFIRHKKNRIVTLFHKVPVHFPDVAGLLQKHWSHYLRSVNESEDVLLRNLQDFRQTFDCSSLVDPRFPSETQAIAQQSFLVIFACYLAFLVQVEPVLADVSVPAVELSSVGISNSSECQSSEPPSERQDTLEKATFDVSLDSYETPPIPPIAQSEPARPFLDFASVLNSAKAKTLVDDLQALEDETGWRLRVLTRSISSAALSAKDLKDLWKPDEKTVIVLEDLNSPNILSFNTGLAVNAKLPRQFFNELQSRYGNQFFVQQEGEADALLSTTHAIEECLRKQDGCNNVPGLTNDLYYLTLATSIAGGCVFGFAARVPPSGRVEASWQWVVILSPLWLLLFGSFGVLPIVGRTTEWDPLLKNTIGFLGGAIAIYLTPIFGPSPISKQ